MLINLVLCIFISILYYFPISISLSFVLCSTVSSLDSSTILPAYVTTPKVLIRNLQHISRQGTRSISYTESVTNVIHVYLLYHSSQFLSPLVQSYHKRADPIC